MENKTVIITGANGFLGSHLKQYFTEKDYTVLPFVRKPKAGEFAYDLQQPLDEKVLQKADVIVHCAFITQAQHPEAFRINFEGTRDLIDRCEKLGKKLLFVSTLAAHPNAESDYGKHKFALEQLIDTRINAIIKPALIVGNGGLFSRIAGFATKFRMVPLIDQGRQPFQFIAIEDVAKAVERIVNQDLSGHFTLTSQEDIDYKTFYKKLQKTCGKRIILLPIPINFIVGLLRMTERIGLKLPVNSENVLGLKKIRKIDGSASSTKLGIASKPLEQLLKETLPQLESHT